MVPGEVAPSLTRVVFPPPFGAREVSDDFSPADIVTVPSHLTAREVRAWLHVGDRVADRPEQTFVVEAVVRRGDDERRARARGKDIYGISARLAGEAVARILDGRVLATGTVALGKAFEATSFLSALPLTELSAAE